MSCVGDYNRTIMNIEHIALNVSDPVALADWWVQHLGMRVVRQVDGPPFTRFLADGAGRTVLEVYRQEVAAVPDYAAMHPMMLHVAFLSGDVKADHRRLLAAGASDASQPALASNGDELAIVRDPWGVCVQLVKRSQPMLG
jgi:glyoxylase I family protein